MAEPPAPGESGDIPTLRALLDGLPALVSYWDRDQRSTVANQAFLDFFGLPEAHARGHHLRDLLDAEAYATNVPHALGALAGHEQLVEETLVDAEGTAHEVQASYTPYRVAGETVGFVMLVSSISARRRAESRRDQALHLSDLAIEYAPIPTAVVGMDGRWLQVNRALCELTGYASYQLLGMNFRDITHPDDLDEAEASMQRLRDGSATKVAADKRYVRADGTVVWVHRTAVLLRGDEHTPDLFVIQVQDVSARKRAQEDLSRLATTDSLTGLSNRLLLLDRLQHATANARRAGSALGILFIDLDHFKSVNDLHGHSGGDEVLRQVAHRLRAELRDSDTVARLGGDEFVIVCEGVDDPPQFIALAERVRDVLNGDYQVDGGSVLVSASIGMTIGSGPDGALLLRQADRSMYRAKNRGFGLVDIYDQAEQEAALDTFALDQELRQGLLDDQLRLVYQPIIRLRNGDVDAREALIRWEHPIRGLLQPETFLAGAEQSGLINEVGNWVLERACADAAAWPDSAAVCVNVSARHLATPDFVDLVRKSLSDNQIDGSRLKIEITEGLVLTASPSTLKSTMELTAIGVSCVLDDFGTGQSSIAALQRLPIDALKIDRSFIADLPANPTSAGLVDGLIHLGSSLGVDVIAEGVETVAQADWLIQHGCPHGQGFLFGVPSSEVVGEATWVPS